jgi:hypothetical protein
MKCPLLVKIQPTDTQGNDAVEFLLTQLEPGKFSFITVGFSMNVSESWNCSETSALSYFKTSLYEYLSTIQSNFKVLEDSQNLLHKLSYCCGNDSCRALLFRGYRTVVGIEILCKKCKQVSPPFNFK